MIIILRVARGQAWDSDTVSVDRLSSMKAVGGRKSVGPSGLSRGRRLQEISTVQFAPGQTGSSGHTVVQKKTIGSSEQV